MINNASEKNILARSKWQISNNHKTLLKTMKYDSKVIVIRKYIGHTYLYTVIITIVNYNYEPFKKRSVQNCRVYKVSFLAV